MEENENIRGTDNRGTNPNERANSTNIDDSKRGFVIQPAQLGSSPIDVDRLYHPPLSFRHVWASNLHTFNVFGVWNPVLNFTNSEGLLQVLTIRRVEAMVELGIISHGNNPGVLDIGPTITHLNITTPVIQTFFSRLKLFFALNSSTFREGPRIVFYGCIAGRGSEGTRLLIEISRIMNNITVVGFTTVSVISPTGNAGDVRDSGIASASGITSSTSILRLPMQNPSSDSAKWALNGNITRFATNDDVAYLRSIGRIR